MKMQKNSSYLFVIVMAMIALLVVACTPTGGEPESAAAEPTETVDAGIDESEESESVNGELTGMRWVLVSYLNENGEVVEALVDHETTVEFGADGNLGGNAGCNRYFAEYSADGGNLTIGSAGSTMMACEPAELMQQEARFLANLQAAVSFVIQGEQLQIADAEGQTVLTFQATEPVSLIGANWNATSYNTGTEAVSSLIADTTITAVFSEDGKLSGSAGCNNYMTSYTLDGNAITIQPPATTRKFCAEPEGLMEQEAAFVSMLPQSATYSISGNVLELRTADGALIASFTAAP